MAAKAVFVCMCVECDHNSVCVCIYISERERYGGVQKHNNEAACLEIDFVYLQRQVYTGSTSD